MTPDALAHFADSAGELMRKENNPPMRTRSRLAKAVGFLLALSVVSVPMSARAHEGHVALEGADPASWKAKVTGASPHAALLCRFPDRAGEPHPVSWYEDLFADSYPGAGHYWFDVSYGKLDLRDTQVHGWFTLPQPYDHYVPGGDTDQSKFFQIADDCDKAATAAGVDLESYSGKIYWFNDHVGSVGGASRAWIGMDADPRIYGVLAHEMGHSFGWPHSDVAENPYGSAWDVMGAISSQCHVSPCVPVHPIAEYKRWAGWIPEEDVLTARAGTDEVITVAPLDKPAVEPGQHRMARVLIQGKQNIYYTIEVRRQAGYDVGVPAASGVIIHRFQNGFVVREDGSYEDSWDGGKEPALLTPEGAAEPGGPGSAWQSGSTLVDEENLITVSVLGRNEDGSYDVRVESDAPAEPELLPRDAYSYRSKAGADSFSVKVAVWTSEEDADCAHHVPVKLQRRDGKRWVLESKGWTEARGQSEGGLVFENIRAPREKLRVVVPPFANGWRACERVTQILPQI